MRFLSKSKRQKPKPNSKGENNSLNVEERDDLSVQNPPMETSVRGVADLVKALSDGTEEFKKLIFEEFELVYECRICRSLFRSVNSLTYHKREFCTELYKDKFHSRQEPLPSSNLVLVEPQPVEAEGNSVSEECAISNIDNVSGNMEDSTDLKIVSCPITSITTRKLRTRNKLINIVNQLAEQNENNKNLTIEQHKETSDNPSGENVEEVLKENGALEGTEFCIDIAERVAVRRNHLREQTLKLEKVDKTNKAVYQTLLCENNTEESIRTEISELERLPTTAVLKENGTVLQNNITREMKHHCTYCQARFITEKTLTKHVTIHHRERTCYLCPICRVYFASPRAVYRHLGRAHHRTEEQIRRLRKQVLSKSIKKRHLHATRRPRPIVSDLYRLERENEKWIKTFEGDLRCSTCGKKFNRRAALRVHSLTCKVKSEKMNKTKSEKKVEKVHLQVIQTMSPKIIPPVYEIRQEESDKVGIQIRRVYNKESKSAEASPVKQCQICSSHICTCKLVNQNRLEQVTKRLEMSEEAGSDSGSFMESDSPSTGDDSSDVEENEPQEFTCSETVAPSQSFDNQFIGFSVEEIEENQNNLDFISFTQNYKKEVERLREVLSLPPSNESSVTAQVSEKENNLELDLEESDDIQIVFKAIKENILKSYSQDSSIAESIGINNSGSESNSQNNSILGHNDPQNSILERLGLESSCSSQQSYNNEVDVFVEECNENKMKMSQIMSIIGCDTTDYETIKQRQEFLSKDSKLPNSYKKDLVDCSVCSRDGSKLDTFPISSTSDAQEGHCATSPVHLQNGFHSPAKRLSEEYFSSNIIEEMCLNHKENNRDDSPTEQPTQRKSKRILHNKHVGPFQVNNHRIVNNVHSASANKIKMNNSHKHRINSRLRLVKKAVNQLNSNFKIIKFKN